MIADIWDNPGGGVAGDSTILIKKYPKVYVFYNFLGYSLEKKNQIYEAEAVFDKSLEINSKNIFALINLGRISRLVNNLQRSEKLLKEALDLEPENLFAQFCLRNFC